MIKDLILGKAGDPGRYGDDNRLFVNACVYVPKTAVPREDLPERFGKSETAEASQVARTTKAPSGWQHM